MDQSNYTAQTTSNEKKKTSKLDSLKGLGQGKKKEKNKNISLNGKAPKKNGTKAGKNGRKTGKAAKGKVKKNAVTLKPEQVQQIIRYVKDIVIGIILGAGAFFTIISQFGLTWSYKSWPNGSFTGGLVKSWNTVADTLASSDGVFLTKLMGEGDSNGFFLTVVLLFLLVISVLVVMGRVKWMALVYPAAVIIPTILWGVQASVISICVLALGILLFMINTDVHELKFSYRGFIYALLLAFAAFVVISIPGVTNLADRTTAVNDIREDITENISESYYGKSALNDGDLTVKNRSTGSGTALQVTMSTPQSMYLRGFVGDTLEKDGWTPLSNATYYEESNFVYWMNQNGFNGLGQLGQAAELAKQGGKKHLSSTYMENLNDVSVENVGTSTKYAYIPYEITIDGVENTKNWGDSFLTGGKFKRLKAYSFTTEENATAKWTDYASMLFSNRVTPSDQTTYMENESYYNAYVYDKFTYISDSDRAILSMAMPAAGDQTRGHVEYNKAIKSVKQLISINFTYSDTLTGYSKKETALRNIFDNLSGYDAQLATAAVMMFRYYGIPARYVEGYLITKDDVASGDTTVNVSRKNAHAWCEIYVDGLGFVPIEVCSNYSGLMDEADYSVGIKTKQTKDNVDQSKTHDQDPNIITEDNSSSAEKKMPNRVVMIVGAVVALLLLILLVIGIVKLIRKIRAYSARRKLFKRGEPREAVTAMYAYMESLGLEPDEETRRLGNMATYSEHNISIGDRSVMFSKIKILKQRKKADQKLEKARKRIENSRGTEKQKKARMEMLMKKSSMKGKKKTAGKSGQKQAAKGVKANNASGNSKKGLLGKSNKPVSQKPRKKKPPKKNKKVEQDKYSSYERK